MRKPITIFLLIFLVSIQTPAGQLFKIPLLVEHLIKHKKQNDVSLLDFLKEHYAASHNDSDLPEDEQLPFKTLIYYNIDYAIIPGIIKSSSFVSLPFDRDVLFYVNDTPQQHLVNIFHPPRI